MSISPISNKKPTTLGQLANQVGESPLKGLDIRARVQFIAIAAFAIVSSLWLRYASALATCLAQALLPKRAPPAVGSETRASDSSERERAELAQRRFQAAFPQETKTLETFGQLAGPAETLDEFQMVQRLQEQNDAHINQLKKELDRDGAIISICHKPVRTIEEFRRELANTPFVFCERQIAELLHQAILSSSMKQVFAIANDQINRDLTVDQDPIALSFKQAERYRADFSPKGEGPDEAWVIEGGIALQPTAVSEQFPIAPDGNRATELAPRLEIACSAELPLERAGEAVWANIPFTHRFQLG